jgi:hypothetical protein
LLKFSSPPSGTKKLMSSFGGINICFSFLFLPTNVSQPCIGANVHQLLNPFGGNSISHLIMHKLVWIPILFTWWCTHNLPQDPSCCQSKHYGHACTKPNWSHYSCGKNGYSFVFFNSKNGHGPQFLKALNSKCI